MTICVSSKRCPHCETMKPPGEFGLNRTKKDGRSTWCLECNRVSARGRYRKHPERQAGIRRKYHLKKFGLTESDHDRMLSDQAGGCAICGSPPGSQWGRLHIDHDHQTGLVRGLLCETCNPGIGHFKDSPEMLEIAAEYLRSADVRS